MKKVAIGLVMVLVISLSGCSIFNNEPSIEKAEDLVDDEKFDEAIEMYEDLLDEDDEDHDLWKGLVEAYLEDEEWEDAADVMEDWSEIIEEQYKEDPDDVEDAIEDYYGFLRDIQKEDDDIDVYSLVLGLDEELDDSDNQENETPNEEPLDQEVAIVEEIPDEEVYEYFELEIWEQMDSYAQEVFDIAAQDFMQMYPEINITRIHFETQELRDRVQIAAAAGDGPSLVYGPSDFIGVFQQWGVIQPITNILSYSFLETIDPIAMNSTKLYDDYYMLPDINGNQIALIYNKDIVAEAPNTWDELVAIASENQDNGGYGFLYNEAEPYWFVGFYNGFGGEVLDDNYNPTLNNQAMIDALTFVRDIRLDQGLGVEGMDYNLTDTMFKAGEVAMILNGAWSWADYESTGINIGVARAPILPSGMPPIFYNATKGYAISEFITDETETRAIKLFLEYMLSTEVNAQVALASNQAPTVLSTRELSIIKNDPYQVWAIDTIGATIGMPIVAEMTGIWDALRFELAEVLYNGKDPAAAAAAMQIAAEANIADIRSE